MTSARITLGGPGANLPGNIVERHHGARPAGYRPLDDFWRRRGYGKVPGAVARSAWRDRGDAAATEKPMELWLRDLDRPAPFEG